MVNWSRLIGRSLHSPIGSASIFGAAGCSGISSSFSCSAIHYFGVFVGLAVTSQPIFSQLLRERSPPSIFQHTPKEHTSETSLVDRSDSNAVIATWRPSHPAAGGFA